MVPLKIVSNVSRFKPALILNRVLADLNRGSNSLNSISDCHLSSHDFHSYNSTTITSYLSSYIRFNAKSTSKDLYSYNSTRSQAIFQAIFNSMLNQLAKISARNVSTRTMTTSNTVIKAESKSIFNSLGYNVNRNWRNSIPSVLLISHD